MQLINYLNNHLLTQAQLLEAAGITLQQLNWLQELAIMPRPAYRLTIDVHCNSFFGEHQEHDTTEYYAKGYVSWLADINASLESADPVAHSYHLFEQRYLQQAQRLVNQGLLPDRFSHGQQQLDETLLCQHINQEWLYFGDGIYGLCTSSGLPEAIADKEFAICLIDQLTDKQQLDKLPDADRDLLIRAVTLLDRASSPFAPHERHRSSRHRCIDRVRQKYGL